MKAPSIPDLGTWTLRAGFLDLGSRIEGLGFESLNVSRTSACRADDVAKASQVVFRKTDRMPPE